MRNLFKIAYEKNANFTTKGNEHILKKIITANYYQRIYDQELTHIDWYALLSQRVEALYLATENHIESVSFEENLNIGEAKSREHYKEMAGYEINALPEHQAFRPIDGFEVVSLLKTLPDLEEYKGLEFLHALELLETEQLQNPCNIDSKNIIYINHLANPEKLETDIKQLANKLRKKDSEEKNPLTTQTGLSIDKLKLNLIIPFLDILIYANTRKTKISSDLYKRLLTHINYDLIKTTSSLNKPPKLKNGSFESKDLANCKRLSNIATSQTFLDSLLCESTIK